MIICKWVDYLFKFPNFKLFNKIEQLKWIDLKLNMKFRWKLKYFLWTGRASQVNSGPSARPLRDAIDILMDRRPTGSRFSFADLSISLWREPAAVFPLLFTGGRRESFQLLRLPPTGPMKCALWPWNVHQLTEFYTFCISVHLWLLTEIFKLDVITIISFQPIGTFEL